MSNPYDAPRAELEDPLPAPPKTVPASYWAFWKRGWWVVLMVFVLNLAVLALIFPFAMLLANQGPAYSLACAILILGVAVPLSGWLFEVFASGSKRIVTRRRKDVSPAQGPGGGG